MCNAGYTGPAGGSCVACPTGSYKVCPCESAALSLTCCQGNACAQDFDGSAIWYVGCQRLEFLQRLSSAYRFRICCYISASVRLYSWLHRPWWCCWSLSFRKLVLAFGVSCRRQRENSAISCSERFCSQQHGTDLYSYVHCACRKSQQATQPCARNATPVTTRTCADPALAFSALEVAFSI